MQRTYRPQPARRPPPPRLPAPPARRLRRFRRRWSPLRVVATLVGAGMIVAGALTLAIPLWHVWQRGHTDQGALNQWIQGASGDTHDPAVLASNCHAATAPGDDAFLVSFPTLTAYHYAAVAGDGTWDLLETRSMVHYATSPAPGGQGNVIIAFHREPGFEHISELAAGGLVTVENRQCQTYTYQVTARWVLSPNEVTQLEPTSGHDLTLITCTPWYVDNQRIVWRASLVSGPSGPAH